MTRSFSCLYTKHKTQKRKKWNDGKLTVSPSGIIHLYPCASSQSCIIQSNANAKLDSLAMPVDQVKLILTGNVTDLEMDNFLIEIDSEWKPTPSQSHPTTNKMNTITNTISKGSNGSTSAANRNTVRKKNNGMEKILANKFRKPSKYIPKPKQNMNGALTRKRPLQPGEYLRQLNHGLPLNTNSGGYNSNSMHQYNGGNHWNGNNQNQNSNAHIQNQGQQMILPNKNRNGMTGTGTDTDPSRADVIRTNQGLQPQHQGQGMMRGLPQRSQHTPQPSQQQNPYAPLQPPRPAEQGQNANWNQMSSRNAHLQSRPQPQHRQSQSKNQFVSNDFDPNSFYEEEDSDDDENDDSGAFHMSQNQGHSESETDERQKSDAMQRAADTNTLLPQNMVDESLRSNNNGNQDLVTNSDLLQIFCGGNNNDVDKQSCGGIGTAHGEDGDSEDSDGSEGSTDEASQSQVGNDNPFLEGLLQSEAELDRNPCKVTEKGSAWNYNAIDDDTNDDMNENNNDDNDAGVRGDLGNKDDRGRELEACNHDGNKTQNGGGNDPAGVERHQEESPVAFDINVPDFDSDSTESDTD